MGELVEKMGNMCQCTTGPSGAVSGYLAYGTSMDYMYHAVHVPYPLTIEIFGGGGEGLLKPGGWLNNCIQKTLQCFCVADQQSF